MKFYKVMATLILTYNCEICTMNRSDKKDTICKREVPKISTKIRTLVNWLDLKIIEDISTQIIIYTMTDKIEQDQKNLHNHFIGI